jgi:hypothetical protein
MSYSPKNRVSPEFEESLREPVTSFSKGLQEGYRKSAESFISKVKNIKKVLKTLDDTLVKNADQNRDREQK